MDAVGNLYITNHSNRRISMVTPAGIITTVATIAVTDSSLAI